MSKLIGEAVALLRDDNLVWSSDMESVKLELATLLEVSSTNEMTRFVAEGLAKRLINPEGVVYDRGLEKR